MWATTKTKVKLHHHYITIFKIHVIKMLHSLKTVLLCAYIFICILRISRLACHFKDLQQWECFICWTKHKSPAFKFDVFKLSSWAPVISQYAATLLQTDFKENKIFVLSTLFLCFYTNYSDFVLKPERYSVFMDAYSL